MPNGILRTWRKIQSQAQIQAIGHARNTRKASQIMEKKKLLFPIFDAKKVSCNTSWCCPEKSSRKIKNVIVAFHCAERNSVMKKYEYSSSWGNDSMRGSRKMGRKNENQLDSNPR